MNRRKMIGLALTLITAITLVILFGTHLLGLDPEKKIAQYLVDQWKESDGIPTNTVISISQTPDGYLWLATQKSLVRFDGKKFSNIPFNEKEKNDSPTTLFVDRNGILWIGSEKGLTSYDHKTGRFKNFTSHDGLTDDHVRRIKDDLNGNLWISFRSSFINRFSNGAFTVLEPPDGLTGNVINAIVQDHKGNLLFGSSEKGVFIYKDRMFSPYPAADIKGSQLIAMIEDSKGDLWIGTTTGLFRVNDKSTQKYTTKEGLSNNRIHAILEDKQGNFWIATEKGLNRLKRKQGSKIAVQHFLKEITFISLFEDREKSIWAATLNSGLIRLKQGTFTSYGPFEAKPDEMFCSLYKDRQGYILTGAVNGKLSRYQGEELKEAIPPREFFSTSIIAIHEDTEGSLWLGTMGNGDFQKKKNSFVQ
jgi:ligand-binding sensor domain-containing protein